MTKRADFHQSDLTRAIKACLDAGLELGTFSVVAEAGRVRVLTGGAAQEQPLTALERWERENGDRAA